jgi:F-type H+-transporting ATPase subunit b
MLDFSVTFFITLINLGVLFFVMRLILFKPVRKFMASRQAEVKNEIDAAAKQRADADALLAQYQKKLAEAKADGDAIIKEARAGAEAEAQRIVSQAKADAQAIREKAGRDMQQERETALSEFQSQAVGLVLAVSAKLLERQLSDEDSRKQAALFLKELSSSDLRAVSRV